MSLTIEAAKRDTLISEINTLTNELKALEDAIDYSAIEAKKAEIKAKSNELKIPIAAKELQELAIKYQAMPQEDTYEYRYVVSKLKRYQQILLDSGLINEAIL